MLFAFRVEDDNVKAAKNLSALNKDVALLRVDLVEPSHGELETVQELFEIEVGSLEELQNTEATARFIQRSEDQP